MNLTVLSCRDHEKWNSYLDKIPDDRKSPHFSPEYYKLFEKRQEGKGICFIGEENEKVILYPTLINSITDFGYDLDKEYYDIQGAYGYNGPISNTSDLDFINNFSGELQQYFYRHEIIAEFIRYCPVIGNHSSLEYIQPVHVLDNVMIDLSFGYENVWKNSFVGGVRKAIRKAIKNDLEFELIKEGQITEQIVQKFHAIYIDTMKRNSAEEYYLFSVEFVRKLVEQLSNNVLICFALYKGSTVSTELLLYNGKNAYGFLGGTLPDAYAVSPNSFLRNELIKYLIKIGVKRYSIGGGKSKDDSVYAFKKSFSKNQESKFYIGKKIHNQAVYDDIVMQWKLKYPDKLDKYKNYLLKYRY